MKTLSILIVNWNTRTLLRNLLTSIYEHAPHCDYEVIVVDNASTDGSRKMVTAEFPGVKLMVSPSNMGFARAVNPGIRESSGQYILLLNTDLVVLEGAIDSQVEFMNAHPRCAFCGGLLLDDQGVPRYTYGRFPSVRNLLAEVIPGNFKERYGITAAGSTEQTNAMSVDFVSGADMIVSRAFCESAGLLDEQFFMYFEEADWEFRAKQLGWEVYFVPSVRYMHYGAGTVGWENVKRYWIPSLGLFIRKNYHGTKFVICWALWQLLRVKWIARTSLQHGAFQRI